MIAAAVREDDDRERAALPGDVDLDGEGAPVPRGVLVERASGSSRFSPAGDAHRVSGLFAGGSSPR